MHLYADVFLLPDRQAGSHRACFQLYRMSACVHAGVRAFCISPKLFKSFMAIKCKTKIHQKPSGPISSYRRRWRRHRKSFRSHERQRRASRVCIWSTTSRDSNEVMCVPHIIITIIPGGVCLVVTVVQIQTAIVCRFTMRAWAKCDILYANAICDTY